MRIVYYHFGLWPSSSPSTTFVTYNLAGFARAGYDFTLITVRNTPRNQKEVLAQYFDLPGNLRLELLNPGLLKRFHGTVNLLCFLRLLRDTPDVLITRNLNFLPWALCLRKLRGTRVFFESHDFFADLSRRDTPIRGKDRRRMLLEKACLPIVDGIVCHSDYLRRLYTDTLGASDHFFTATTGVKQFGGVRTPDHFRYRIGYIGSFSPDQYDLGLLIQALAQLKTPNVTLVIAGSRSESSRQRILALAEKAGVADRVEIHGWLTSSDLHQLKDTLDFGLSPLTRCFLSDIKSPLKVLEYLAHHLPVFSSDAIGSVDILRDTDTGWLLNNDPNEWALAIDTAYGDFSAYLDKREKCRQLAADYSWENRAHVIVANLKRITGLS